MFDIFKSLDWEKSRAHKLFLSYFINPREVTYFTRDDSWEKVLKEKPQKAFERFVKLNLIRPCGPYEKLTNFNTVAQLKELLKQKGLPVSGKKEDLCNRLISYDEKWIEKIYSSKNVFCCTEMGILKVKEFDDFIDNERKDAEFRVIDAIKKRDFHAAWQIIGQFELNQVYPNQPGYDLHHPDDPENVFILTTIMDAKPKILSQLPDNEAELLRIEACLNWLWTNPKYSSLPENFQTTHRFGIKGVIDAYTTYAAFQKDKRLLQQLGVKKVQSITLNDEDVCPACKALSKKKILLSEFPELPYEKCTCELGCRCDMWQADWKD